MPDRLDSLLWQSFDHAYEIIYVDDGSADSSKEVVRAYQKRYPNTRLVEKENGGVSSARNAGLKQAEGEYVWFVDPDDYISPNCLAGIYAAFLRFPEAEMLYFNVREVAEDASPDGGVGEADVRIIPGAKPLVEACGMVNKICRRTFLLKNTLWADEAIAYGEDILWSNLAALACESYITSDAVLYNYRQRKNSVSGLKNVEKTQKGGWRIRSPLQSGILSFITRKRIRQNGKNCLACIAYIPNGPCFFLPAVKERSCGRHNFCRY